MRRKVAPRKVRLRELLDLGHKVPREEGVFAGDHVSEQKGAR